jgi:putative sigma-54 modulation protein
MDVTEAIRTYVKSKVERLPRYYDGIGSVEVILDVEAEHTVVEIIVKARRKATFVATHRDQDLYAGFDQCLAKIVEQLRRHKDKVRDHQGASLSEIVPEAPETE